MGNYNTSELPSTKHFPVHVNGENKLTKLYDVHHNTSAREQIVQIRGPIAVECTIKVDNARIEIEGDQHSVTVLGNQNNIVINGSDTKIRIQGHRNILSGEGSCILYSDDDDAVKDKQDITISARQRVNSQGAPRILPLAEATEILQAIANFCAVLGLITTTISITYRGKINGGRGGDAPNTLRQNDEGRKRGMDGDVGDESERKRNRTKE